MDVIFEPQVGRPFSIEVGFFDTVLEIKEKIQKYQGIPLHKQTLFFNGQLLHDDHDVAHCQILQNSHIHLVVVSDHVPDKPPPHIKTEESSPPKTTLQLTVTVPSSYSKSHFPLQMDADDTILRLKEKIHDQILEHPNPLNRLVIQSCTGGGELQDHRSLRDCELSDNSEISVSIKPPPAASGGGSVGAAVPTGHNNNNKRLKLMVLPKCGNKKISVEVNASDNVGELRKELQKLHQRHHFHLPQEGYFFIYKQNVMDDDRSFRWHHVCQGDTIEIFNGSVTGGS